MSQSNKTLKLNSVKLRDDANKTDPKLLTDFCNASGTYIINSIDFNNEL